MKQYLFYLKLYMFWKKRKQKCLQNKFNKNFRLRTSKMNAKNYKSIKILSDLQYACHIVSLSLTLVLCGAELKSNLYLLLVDFWMVFGVSLKIPSVKVSYCLRSVSLTKFIINFLFCSHTETFVSILWSSQIQRIVDQDRTAWTVDFHIQRSPDSILIKWVIHIGWLVSYVESGLRSSAYGKNRINTEKMFVV